AQYYEVLDFAQFGSDLDEETRKMINHGRHLTELLKQRQYNSFGTADETVVLLANQLGLIDDIELNRIDEYQNELLEYVRAAYKEQYDEIENTGDLTDEVRERLAEGLNSFTEGFRNRRSA
ncbi:MAG: F0F1 ATP synthase subunit alpha, partial [Erysipelotrichaceae bacterium]|nr:F0F1 ATP synthase subunit alpha [Erysipelotrichaceae bacterium]